MQYPVPLYPKALSRAEKKQLESEKSRTTVEVSVEEDSMQSESACTALHETIWERLYGADFD